MMKPSHRHHRPSPINPLKYKDNDRVTLGDSLLERYGNMGFYRLYRKLGTPSDTPSLNDRYHNKINILASDDDVSLGDDDVSLPLISFVEVHHG